MPLQNRVTPEGQIVASTQRGTMMGNRGGCFHRDDRTLKRRHWATKQWICCVLSFKARQRASMMQPGLYTELFFLDEATAMAAGHRPCFECRRADAVRFQQLWAATVGRGVTPRAGDMDDVLHLERLVPVADKPERTLASLPAGVMVRHDGRAHLWHGERLWPWSLEGYGASVRVPGATHVAVLTPVASTTVIAAGFAPHIHASARG